MAIPREPLTAGLIVTGRPERTDSSSLSRVDTIMQLSTGVSMEGFLSIIDLAESCTWCWKRLSILKVN